MSEFLAGASGTHRHPGYPDMAGPQMPRKPAEWEQDIDMLDEKEMELHQTQPKIVQDRTPAFMHDLNLLRQEVEGLKANYIDHDKTLAKFDFHPGTINDRVDTLYLYIETKVDKKLGEWQVEMEKMREQIGGKSSMTDSLKQHHSSLAERLDFLEQAFGDSAGKHAAELDALKAAHGKHALAFDKHSKDFEAFKAAQAVHATVVERLDYAEQTLGDSYNRQFKELEALKAAHSRHEAAFSKYAVGANHASLGDRLDYLEKLLGDSVERHAVELEALKRNHGKHADAFGKHAKELDALKAAQAHHATLPERVDYMEKLLGDSADKHTAALEALKVAHDKHEAAFCKHTKEFEVMKAAHTQHATVGDRLDYLEKLIGDSADAHAAELAALKAAHDTHAAAFGKHAKAFEGLKAAHSHHATLEERLKYVESLLGDSADKHFAELEALKAAHAKLAGDHSARNSKLQELLVREKDAREAHHASVQERLTFLESLLGDSAEKHDQHAANLEDVKKETAKLVSDLKARTTLQDDKHCSLADRLDKLAKDKNAGDAKHGSTSVRLGYLDKLLGGCAQAHQKAVEALKASHAKHAKDLDGVKAAHAQHASMAQRVDYLESALGDSADKHAKALEDVHAKLLDSGKASDDHHESLAERISDLEKRSSQGVKAAYAKIEQLNSRFIAVQEAWKGLSPRP